MTKAKDLAEHTSQAPLKRCFHLDIERASDACAPVKKNTQLAQDCRLLIEQALEFFASHGVENFRLSHADEARRLEITEARVKKAISRLKAAGVLIQTRHQAPGFSSRYRVSEKFANKAGTKALQNELRAATQAAKQEVLSRRGKPSLSYGRLEQ